MLHRLIAHYLDKSTGSTVAALQLKDRVIPTGNPIAENLLSQLRGSFRNKNPSAGAFERAAENVIPPFEQILKTYLASQTDDTFAQFSQAAMGLLLREIQRQPAALGGYVVFAEFEVNEAAFLLVALLSTSAKPSFDADLNLVATISLDMDQLRHGVRARLSGIAENEEGVLQFLSRGKAGAISQYFTDFIGCEELIRPVAQANRLHIALVKWSVQNALSEDEAVNLEAAAYAYWKNCRHDGSPMTLTGIANAIAPNNSAPLLAFLANEENQLPGEMPPPPQSAMRKFIRFAFRMKGLTLEFDRNKWANKIDFNPDEGTVTIREAPHELLNQLSGEDEP